MTRPILYSKPDCGQCDMSKLVLDRRGVDYREVNIEEDDVALDFITNGLGYMQAPVMFIGPNHHWSGFRPDLLATIPKAG